MNCKRQRIKLILFILNLNLNLILYELDPFDIGLFLECNFIVENAIWKSPDTERVKKENLRKYTVNLARLKLFSSLNHPTLSILNILVIIE